ncbi:MAG TPA: hypothetical protein VJ842_17515 [Pyrinomonadaceae bacterium]|nr:hypothetical protein [Pyrinomonadaceae bacterium]
MSEKSTQETPDARSFEERIFARFDSLDTRLDNLDGRLTSLEDKVDARLRETRPIWEGVLSEIKSMNRQMRMLHEDVLRVRVDHEDLRERISKLESEPTR